jgi:hypothetical protein
MPLCRPDIIQKNMLTAYNRIVLLCSMFLLLSTYNSTGQSFYNGNANTGFGGLIGTSSLSIIETGNTVSCVLITTATSFDDVLVMYIDSKTGGFSNTAGFTDEADPLRAAVSGQAFGSSNNQSAVNFDPGFDADYAIAFTPNSPIESGALYKLNTAGNHQLVADIGLAPKNNTISNSYTFYFDKTAIGLSSINNFKFVITYLSYKTATRSDEAYGNGIAPGNIQAPAAASFTYSLSYPTSVLPIRFNAFTLKTQEKNISLKWEIEQTGDLQKFIVERSKNGVSYQPITEITGSFNQNNYFFIDKNPIPGNNYYRIRAVEVFGQNKLSDVRLSIFKQIDNSVFIYNNPVSGDLIFSTASLPKGQWNAAVTNSSGQQITTKVFEKNDRILRINMPLKAGLSRGIYYLVLTNSYQFFKQNFMIQ